MGKAANFTASGSLRRSLAVYLMLAFLAGPALCCCAPKALASELSQVLAVSESASDEAFCCCPGQDGCEEDSSNSQHEPGSCPCQDQADSITAESKDRAPDMVRGGSELAWGTPPICLAWDAGEWDAEIRQHHGRSPGSPYESGRQILLAFCVMRC